MSNQFEVGSGKKGDFREGQGKKKKGLLWTTPREIGGRHQTSRTSGPNEVLRIDPERRWGRDP